MPPFKYWVGLAALLPVLTFIVGAALGLLGLVPLIPDNLTSWVFYLFLLVAAVTWLDSARKAREADKQRHDAAGNKQIFEKLLEAAIPRAKEETLKDASNLQIKQRAVVFVERLRALDRSNPTTAAAEAAFKSDFFPEGSELLEELSRRLGKRAVVPGTEYQLLALKFGQLVGSEPLSRTALYLENLARQLSPLTL